MLIMIIMMQGLFRSEAMFGPRQLTCTLIVCAPRQELVPDVQAQVRTLLLGFSLPA
jgi:hypothetical protein